MRVDLLCEANLFQLLENDSKQRARVIDGLEKIANTVLCYSEIGTVYLRESTSIKHVPVLRRSLIGLFKEILEFQIHAALQSTRSTISQYALNTVHHIKWEEILQRIENAKKECDNLTVRMNAMDDRKCADELKAIFASQNSQIDRLLQELEQFHTELLAEIKDGRKERNEQYRNEREKECHQIFRESEYEACKNRNPDRVRGTCEWFLTDDKFIDWEGSKNSRLLWVSADPGCGKSVLSKSLIDNELASSKTRTTCYFFFKDDDNSQKSVVKALCALLHQLFSLKRTLLRYALTELDNNGPEMLPKLFSPLWNILTKSAADPEAGEIVCVLDALDECEGTGRDQLTDSLTKFYGNRDVNENKMILKFLITSRPYQQIERRLSNMPTIRLAGESNPEKISREIDLVIKDKVQKLKLSPSACATLEKALLAIEHRTYLWLYLIFDVIEESLEGTRRKLLAIINKLPNSVEKAYEAILNQSHDKILAKKILHIVIAAARPLTVQEMNVALAIEENSISHEDLDLEEEEGRFVSRIRRACGLFVSVIDSKIYLIHQTARDFLILEGNADLTNDYCDSSPECWIHSLAPKESNLILARICIWYLLLPEFETRFSMPPPHQLSPNHKQIEIYKARYPFLDYAATNWMSHFQRAEIEETRTVLLKSALKLCDPQTPQFVIWYNPQFTRCFETPTVLMVVSFFGFEAIVQQLLAKDSVEPDSIDLCGRTPLSWAASKGHFGIVELLLKAGADPNRRDAFGQTSLSYTAEHGHVGIVQLLLDNGVEPDSRDEKGRTPLMWAAEDGHETVVKLLLKQGVEADSRDKEGRTALSSAAYAGHKAVVQLLLEHGVEPDSRDKWGQTPLSWAACLGHNGIVRLLLKQGVEPESEDEVGHTPLSYAAMGGHTAIIQLLLERGAESDSRDKDNRTPLWWAASNGRLEAVELLLLEKRVRPDLRDRFGRTPISVAASSGSDKTVQVLIEKGCNINAKDENGRTPLHWIAMCKDKSIVASLLIEHGCDLDPKDVNDQTPLHVAANCGFEEMAALARTTVIGGRIWVS